MAPPIFTIVPYEPHHLAMLQDQASQRGEAEKFGQRRGGVADLGPAFSAVELDDDGNVVTVLVCAGLAELIPPSAEGGGYASAWGYFSEALRPATWSRATAAIRAVLDGCGYARVDALVDLERPQARRYAEALGFTPQAVLFSRSAAERSG